jgi:tetratricopeptide (TPR) repeat protein
VKRDIRIVAIVLFLFGFFSANLFAQSTADDELKAGVEAYKHSRFEEAIQHFERCAALDPENRRARLYLATAYAQQYIPGADTPDNNRFAQLAIEEYTQVLQLDPKNLNSIKGIAYLYLQMKKFDAAKEFYKKASEVDPTDPEPFYSVGVIDWTLSYEPRQAARTKLHMKPDDSLPAKNRRVCTEIKEKNSATVDEGIESLNKAIQLRPDYDDAMAYMNLMYRERADIQCDDPAARSADLRTADKWVDATMATKKAKAERAGDSAEAPPTNPR